MPAVGVVLELAPSQLTCRLKRPERSGADSGNGRTRTFARDLHATGVRSRSGRTTRMGSQMSKSLDSFNCRRTLKAGGAEYVYYSLPEAEKNGLTGISKLPYSMKVLLENLLRNEDGRSVTKESIQAVASWLTD